MTSSFSRLQPNLPCWVASHADVLWASSRVPSPRKRRVWGGLHDEPEEGMRGRLPCAIISRKQSSFPSQSPLVRVCRKPTNPRIKRPRTPLSLTFCKPPRTFSEKMELLTYRNFEIAQNLRPKSRCLWISSRIGSILVIKNLCIWEALLRKVRLFVVTNKRRK